MQRQFFFILPITIGLNISSIFAASLILSQPNGFLWVRNTIFSTPKPLADVSTSAELPPPPSITYHPQNDLSNIPILRQARTLCIGRNHLCLPYTLAGYLATRTKTSVCGSYATRKDLISGVLAGGGCCSDVVKTFLLLLSSSGIQAREVHIPSHTTVEIWDSLNNRWIWLDPFIGYQAFHAKNPLSHMGIYTSFQQGTPVEFTTIKSPWPIDITPTPNYAGHRPSSYQFLYYTPSDSLIISSPLSDALGSLGVNKIFRELILYLSVKPHLSSTASGLNYFLIVASRYLTLSFIFSWISSTLLLVTLLISLSKSCDTDQYR